MFSLILTKFDDDDDVPTHIDGMTHYVKSIWVVPY